MSARAWVAANLDQFDPFYGGRDYEVEYGQRVTELATMAHAYCALTGDHDGREIAAIVDFLRDTIGRREFRDRLVRVPAEFVLFADVCVVLRRLGHPDPELEELVQRVITAGFLDAVERLPHRRMDIRMTLDWGPFEHAWRPQDELLPDSILGREQSALLLDEGATYALTHVLLFWYGFGTERREPPPARLQPLLSRLVVCACQERHWDLLTELLLCWDCADLPGTAVSRLAWDALLGIQNPDGSFPGPERALTWNDPDHPGLEGDTKRRSFFAHHYHTTCIAVIALARHRARSAVPRPGAVVAPRPTTPVEIDPGCFGRARGWLEGLLDRLAASTAVDTRSLCQILLGCRACSAALGDSERFGRTSARVFALLAPDGPSVPDPVGSASRLLAVALFGLGEADGATPAPAPDVRLPASDDETDRLLRWIEHTTALGTRPHAGHGANAALEELLAGLAAHALRQHDLEPAARLVRALVHLGTGHDAVREACAFALLQQRPSGELGFYGLEEPELRRRLGPGFDRDRDLYLPVTAAWLWTLAEASSPWRLASGLRR